MTLGCSRGSNPGLHWQVNWYCLAFPMRTWGRWRLHRKLEGRIWYSSTWAFARIRRFERELLGEQGQRNAGRDIEAERCYSGEVRRELNEWAMPEVGDGIWLFAALTPSPSAANKVVNEPVILGFRLACEQEDDILQQSMKAPCVAQKPLTNENGEYC